MSHIHILTIVPLNFNALKIITEELMKNKMKKKNQLLIDWIKITALFIYKSISLRKLTERLTERITKS